MAFRLSLLLALLAPGSAHAKPAPGVSGTLSVVPGLGRLANGNGWEGAAWFATTVGLLFCWQVHRNNYDLRPSIFAHTWFDFLHTRKGNVAGYVELAPAINVTYRF